MIDFIKACVGFLFLSFWIWGTPFCTILFIIGGIYIRVFLLIVLVYQYRFCKRSPTFYKFMQWLNPSYLLKDFETIWEDGQPSQKTHVLTALHPHGFAALGLGLSQFHDPYLSQHSQICASSTSVLLPWGGICHRWMGTSCVDPKNLKFVMNKGKSITILPGGFEEATLTEYGKDKVYINERKGFIKYALQFGYVIRPSYIFGETITYSYYSFGEKVGFFLNKFKIPAVIAVGRFFMIPKYEKLTTVIGKEIKLPKIQNPSEKDVEKYHTLYIENLQNLYEKYKQKYNKQEQKLMIY